MSSRILVEEVRRLARTGVGILLVEHNFHLVRELAERVIVLDRGHMMLEGLPREIEADPQFVSLYLGNSDKVI